MCILHIVFCTVCKYVLSICKLFFFFFLHCLEHARKNLWWCDNKSDLIWFDIGFSLEITPKVQKVSQKQCWGGGGGGGVTHYKQRELRNNITFFK